MNKIKFLLGIAIFSLAFDTVAGEWTSAQSNAVWVARGSLPRSERDNPGKILIRIKVEKILSTPAVTTNVTEVVHWNVRTLPTNADGSGAYTSAVLVAGRRYNKILVRATYTNMISFDVTRSQIEKILRNDGP